MPEEVKVILIMSNSQGVAYHQMTGQPHMAMIPDEDDDFGWDLLMPRPQRLPHFRFAVDRVHDSTGKYYDRVHSPEESTPIFDQLRQERFEEGFGQVQI